MESSKNPKRAVAELEMLHSQLMAALQAGRKTYWSIVKFESDDNFNKGSLWHLHIRFEDITDYSQNKFITTVGFISQDGPENLLYKGSKFVLMGDDLKTIKAKGTIIDLITLS